ncbi:LysR family transcriptional regulator [Paramicrobacterium agarici]|uniref:DNA-binding transcriptional LysR family regulator n=1 Tax=Paramicrobacterium agarici TaxID=630514 RepID=A0A2A9DRN4_9MICO|nr:LysR family transcriptional regulator [Microbacterium agarici]PFG29254.1 DNA-binding transcriptional LysR family regulator [Microbacterium agarici]
MRVEWSRLRLLDAVARTGSVTRAAMLLHMTGPAVSQQLRRIEVEAGVKVVIPDGRGVRLTNKGRILADYAARVATLMTQAENDLHYGDELVGRIGIGALASIVRTTLVDELPAFQELHPRVELRIEDGETESHLDQLAGGRLDVVFAESWSPTPLRLPAGVNAQRLNQETAWIALPESHPARAKRHITLADLATEVWAACAPESDEHDALTQFARRNGIELDIRHFVSDHVTQLALVRANIAIACVPSPAEKPEAPGIVYRKLLPEMNRDILLLTNDRTQSRHVEALIAHLAAGRSRGRTEILSGGSLRVPGAEATK